MQVSLVTGGFDPLHSGHIAYFKAAAKLGRLVVGVNSDEWLIRKKGRFFMPLEERVNIVRNITGVKNVIVFNDDDNTACDAIATTRQLYFNATINFCNGGDRIDGNIPEYDVFSNARDVVFHYGVGGEDKKNSSSWILKEWNEPKTVRPWGYYRVIHETDTHKVKELTVDPGMQLSLQRHQHRREYWFVSEGIATVETANRYTLLDNLNKRDLNAYDSVDIPTGAWHRLSNNTDTPVRIIEIQYGDQCIESDIERKDCDYDD
jgi:cytidyltransferase-like protein